MTDPVDRRYRVIVLSAAAEAIEEQFVYIRDTQQAPRNADAWLGRVWTAIDGLEFLPGRHGPALENGRRPYEVRRLLLDNHVLLFTIDEARAAVFVLYLRHAARLPRPGDLPRRAP